MNCKIVSLFLTGILYNAGGKGGYHMINHIKAIAMDVDGTLIEKGGRIMPNALAALTELHDKKVLIGLASGRPVDDYMRNYHNLWHLPFDFDFLIGMNGGHLWDRFHGDEVKHFYPLSRDDLHAVHELMKPLGLNAQIYENSQLIAEKWDDMVAASAVRNMQEVVISPFPDRMYRHPNAKIQFRYEMKDKKKVVEFVDHLVLPGHVHAVYTSDGVLEFMDERTNKGVALKEFAKQNQIDLSEIMAFGDMENDTELVKTAGWGVALQNGCKETKEAANAVTEFPVSEDGLGKYLKKHVIGKII